MSEVSTQREGLSSRGVLEVVVEVVARHVGQPESAVNRSAHRTTLGAHAGAIGDSLELIFKPAKPYHFHGEMTVVQVVTICMETKTE